MPQYADDVLPALVGQDIGSVAQPWDGYFRNINISGNVDGANFLTGNGNAIKLQGRDLVSTAPTNSQVIGWNAALSQWEPQNPATGGGGGGATFGFVTTTYSTSPTFTPNPVGSCTFKITLTGNVTSSTLDTSGITAGSLFFYIIVQDGTGGRFFIWPPTVVGGMLIDNFTPASSTITQQFLWDGTKAYALAPGVLYP